MNENIYNQKLAAGDIQTVDPAVQEQVGGGETPIGLWGKLLPFVYGPIKTILFGHKYKASAYASAGQTLTNSNTFYKINLDRERYDPNSNFNTSTYLYTCPVAGYYFVSGHVKLSAVGDRINCAVAKNGNVYITGADSSENEVGYPAAVVSGVVQCVAGDTLELQGWCTGAGKSTQFDANGIGLYLHIHLLSI